MLVRLIILITVVNLVTGYTTCDIKDLGTTATAQFYGRVNTTMENEIETIQNISKYTCMTTCRKKSSCLAFSYEDGSSSCKLYDHDSKSADTSLTPAPGVWFYDMQNENIIQSYVGRCAQGHGCLNGGSCQNDCSPRGYFCACTDLYRGEFCQNRFVHEPVIVQTIIGDASRYSVGFEHKNIHYLVIAAHQSDLLTQVYKYDSDTGSYEYFVSLPSTDVWGMDAFNINGRMFLFVGKHFGNPYATTSQLFVINDETGDFEVHQTFSTNKPLGVSYLRTNDGSRYLLVSNYYGPEYRTDSVVYQWDDNAEEFSQIVLLPTVGAFHSKLFEINGQVFAGIPNFRENEYWNILSVIYKMDTPGSWSLIQSLPESGEGASSINELETEMGFYLVVIRHYDCNQNAIVYRWNPVIEEFEIHQRIPMVDCPVDSEIFKVGGEVFMITSNLRTAWSGGSYSVQNVFYKLEGSIFVKYLTVPGRDAWNWRSFERDGELYLAQSNGRHETNDGFVDTSFKIYQWK